MDAHEPSRIQTAFEISQGLLFQQLPASDHEADVVVPGKHVVDASDRDDVDLRARPHQDAIKMRAGARAVATTRETGTRSARAMRPLTSSSASAKRFALNGFSR